MVGAKAVLRGLWPLQPRGLESCSSSVQAVQLRGGTRISRRLGKALSTASSHRLWARPSRTRSDACSSGDLVVMLQLEGCSRGTGRARGASVELVGEHGLEKPVLRPHGYGLLRVEGLWSAMASSSITAASCYSSVRPGWGSVAPMARLKHMPFCGFGLLGRSRTTGGRNVWKALAKSVEVNARAPALANVECGCLGRCGGKAS